MEIRVLRYFLETAREGNMTRAAERLFISQPTMSKQLKELEKELGTKLFIRSNYSIRLTDAGMLLRERAEDILSLVDKTEAEFKSFEEINSGDIYVGAPESEAMGLFADIVRNLQEVHPRIRCNIYSGNVQDVCEKLDKGLLDFAIVMNYVDLAKYNYLPMSTEDSWGIVFRKDDVLAGIFCSEDLSGLQRCAGRDSYEYTLGYCEPSAFLECIFILDGNDLIIDACIERIRYEACADALDLVGSCRALGKDGGGSGFYCDYLDVGVLLLEITSCACKCTACAYTGSENIDLALGLFPDLGTCCLVVDLGVGRIHELAEDD